MGAKYALLLGASGLTGRYCLQYLLENENYVKVVALVRKPIDIQHPKLLVAIVDFDYTAAMEKYYTGVDDVFCCLGTNIKKAGSLSAFRRVDFHIPSEAANIASAHGVTQFLAISAHHADNHSSNPYLRVKGEMEKGIAQFNFIAIHLFRIPPIKEDLDNENNGGGFLSRILGSSKSSNSDKNLAVSPKMLAAAMIHAAQLHKTGENTYSPSQIIKLSEAKAVSN